MTSTPTVCIDNTPVVLVYKSSIPIQPCYVNKLIRARENGRHLQGSLATTSYSFVH